MKFEYKNPDDQKFLEIISKKIDNESISDNDIIFLMQYFAKNMSFQDYTKFIKDL